MSSMGSKFVSTSIENKNNLQKQIFESFPNKSHMISDENFFGVFLFLWGLIKC